MLDELDHGVGVLGHTMVGPSSEEKVLQFEGLGKWVSSLKGLIIKKLTGIKFVINTCNSLHADSHI